MADRTLTDDPSHCEHESWPSATLRSVPSWLVSMIVHMTALLAMALWITERDTICMPPDLTATVTKTEKLDALEEFKPDPLEQLDITLPQSLAAAADLSTQWAADTAPAENVAPPRLRNDCGLTDIAREHVLDTIPSGGGPAYSRRSRGIPGVPNSGISKESERAVALALRWLANHQLPGGDWSFDLTACPTCRGQCRDSGKMREAHNAATGLALLVFLGAGQTHTAGRYQQTVQNGLYYLTSHMKLGPQGGALNEPGGNMYSHGIDAIAICEAYAMSHDRALLGPAQGVINFIVSAQDPVGGGWRYQPRQPGDTSVVGWQIMALKSGHLAYLRVPPQTIKKAFDFLDSVQAESGANYGYTSPGNGPATTAIGLLCRMYLGWKDDNPALARGVQWLSARGPSKDNFYYNYYATQVMRQWDGDEWKKWNSVMRDQLVNSQVQQGHEAGSWYSAGPHNDTGGRLYCTAMAALTLEVYYRILPVIKRQSIDANFPL